MKYILFILLFNGGVETVEFNSKSDCLGASIDLNLAAARLIPTQKDYPAFVHMFCAAKGAE